VVIYGKQEHGHPWLPVVGVIEKSRD